jgi:hypothetical protein
MQLQYTNSSKDGLMDAALTNRCPKIAKPAIQQRPILLCRTPPLQPHPQSPADVDDFSYRLKDLVDFSQVNFHRRLLEPAVCACRCSSHRDGCPIDVGAMQWTKSVDYFRDERHRKAGRFPPLRHHPGRCAGSCKPSRPSEIRVTPRCASKRAAPSEDVPNLLWEKARPPAISARAAPTDQCAVA